MPKVEGCYEVSRRVPLRVLQGLEHKGPCNVAKQYIPK